MAGERPDAHVIDHQAEQVDGWIDAGSVELTREDLDDIVRIIGQTGAGAGPALPR